MKPVFASDLHLPLCFAPFNPAYLDATVLGLGLSLDLDLDVVSMGSHGQEAMNSYER